MDLISTRESSDSFSADADTSVVFSNDTTTTASSSSDWIKRAVRLRRHEQFQPSRTEISKCPVPPDWITSPTPVVRPAASRRMNLSTLISRRWHSQWRKRDWEGVTDFFKAMDQDECPVHDIIRIGDPNL